MNMSFRGLNESFGTPKNTSTQVMDSQDANGSKRSHKKKKKQEQNTSCFDPRVAEERFASFMADDVDEEDKISDISVGHKKKKKKKNRKRPGDDNNSIIETSTLHPTKKPKSDSDTADTVEKSKNDDDKFARLFPPSTLDASQTCMDQSFEGQSSKKKKKKKSKLTRQEPTDEVITEDMSLTQVVSTLSKEANRDSSLTKKSDSKFVSEIEETESNRSHKSSQEEGSSSEIASSHSKKKKAKKSKDQADDVPGSLQAPTTSSQETAYNVAPSEENEPAPKDKKSKRKAAAAEATAESVESESSQVSDSSQNMKTAKEKSKKKRKTLVPVHSDLFKETPPDKSRPSNTTKSDRRPMTQISNSSEDLMNNIKDSPPFESSQRSPAAAGPSFKKPSTPQASSVGEMSVKRTLFTEDDSSDDEDIGQSSRALHTEVVIKHEPRSRSSTPSSEGENRKRKKETIVRSTKTPDYIDASDSSDEETIVIPAEAAAAAVASKMFSDDDESSSDEESRKSMIESVLSGLGVGGDTEDEDGAPVQRPGSGNTIPDLLNNDEDPLDDSSSPPRRIKTERHSDDEEDNHEFVNASLEIEIEEGEGPSEFLTQTPTSATLTPYRGQRKSQPIKDPYNNPNAVIYLLYDEIDCSHPMLAAPISPPPTRLAHKWKSHQAAEGSAWALEVLGRPVFDSNDQLYIKTNHRAMMSKKDVGLNMERPNLLKMMNYIESNGFLLPPLHDKNTTVLKNVATVKGRKIADVYSCPNFKSGRFNPEEDRQLTENLQTFFYTDLKLSGPQECCDLLREMLNRDLPSACKQVKARLLFAAYVAGPEMVSYRLTYDIFIHIVRLFRSAVRQEHSVVSENAGSSNKRGDAIRLEESISILDYLLEVYEQLLPGEKPDTFLQYLQFKPGNAVWSELARELSRSPSAIKSHFSTKILPVLLKHQKGLDANSMFDWRPQLLRVVSEKLDSSEVKFFKDVDMKQIHEDHLPECTRSQMSKFLRNVQADGAKHGLAFQDAVRARLTRINGQQISPHTFAREEKKKSRKPKALSETKKAQWIEDIYQHFENQLEKLNAAKNARVEELRASQRSKLER